MQNSGKIISSSNKTKINFESKLDNKEISKPTRTLSLGDIEKLIYKTSKGVKINKNDSYITVINSKNDPLDQNKHYSFYMRIIEKYINQINLNFYDLLKNQKIKTSERMLGEITFDKEGNAQHLKIHKWAKDDDTQDLFLLSLKNIRKIQNPPQELISENDNFKIYYGLNISL